MRKEHENPTEDQVSRSWNLIAQTSYFTDRSELEDAVYALASRAEHDYALIPALAAEPEARIAAENDLQDLLIHVLLGTIKLSAPAPSIVVAMLKDIYHPPTNLV